MIDGPARPATPAEHAEEAQPATLERSGRSGGLLCCPRCDYDVASLKPVDLAAKPDGVCPECGFEFGWAELVNRVPAPSWALEPEPPRSPLGVFGRAFGVFRRAMKPSSLWQAPADGIPEDAAKLRLMLVHPVQPRSLLISAAASVAASWFTAAVALALLAGMAFVMLVVRHASYVAYQTATSITSPANIPRIFPRASMEEYATQVMGQVLLPGVPWTASSADTQRLGVMTLWGAGTALLMPVCFLLLGQTMARHRVRKRHLWRIGAYALPTIPMIGLAFSALTWLAHMLESVRVWLSNSRTAAELGVEGYAWAHPERGWVQLTSSADSWLYLVQRWVMREGSVVLGVLVLVFIWLFWYRASSRYLRLPRAAFDTLLLLVVAVLGAPALALIAVIGSHVFSGGGP